MKVRRQRAANVFRVELLEDRTAPATATSLLPFSALAVDPDAYSDSSIIVRFRDAMVNHDWSSVLEGTTLSKPYSAIDGLWQVQLSEGVSVAAAIAAYAASPFVLYAEPDYIVRALVLPNDPNFNLLWGMHNTGQTGGIADSDIDAPEAWDTWTGSSSTLVAVIDTGVDYTHPDLAANIWTNADEIAGNGIDDDLNGYVDDVHGYDFFNHDGDPMDDNQHGTHVAGTIGAVGNNGVGLTGVAWNVDIMALKFLDASGSGEISDAIAAINYAVANGARISNNSWGAAGYSQALYDAIANAAAANHVFVAAAGNDNANTDVSAHMPSGFDLDNIISVAATNHNDVLATFSNYGATTVDLAAPGVDIRSTTPGNTYNTFSGTSMATPHVTGVVALVSGMHTDWTYSQVINQILGTIDPIASLNGSTVTGGRLNAHGALTGTPAPDVKGPFVSASTPSGSIAGSTGSVRITFNESIDAATFTLDDVSNFTGPSGPITATGVIPVAGTNTRKFDITFPTQSALGTYSFQIGPGIADQSGNLMNQDGDGVNGEAADDRYAASFTISEEFVFVSTDVPAPLQFFTGVGSFLTIDQAVTIGDLNVQLNITHPSVGDLLIYLESPTGATIVLSEFRGGFAADFQNTVFDDEAAVSISQGEAPFPGSYQPEQPLALLDGASTLGTWILWVENYWVYDGWLTAWSMTVLPAGGPPSNSPPVANNDAYSVAEDGALVVAVPGVLGNDSDANLDPLSAILVTGPTHGTLSLASNGSFNYSPFANYYGADSFTYKANDGAADSNNATVSLSITAVNDSPLATNDSATTTAGVAVTINVLANDTDIDGDALGVTNLTQPANGVVVLNANKTVTYTPNAGFSGSDAFSYTANDGTANSNIATVSVTVDPQPAGNPNHLYVWDIAFESRNRGKGTPKHDERAVVVVRRDSDADGVAEASDAVVSNASVTVVISGPAGGTFSGSTGATGVFRSAWLLAVPNGTYTAEVTGLSHATYVWTKTLDPTSNDSDLDGDNLPDQQHAVPHAASSASLASAASGDAMIAFGSEPIDSQSTSAIPDDSHALSADAVDSFIEQEFSGQDATTPSDQSNRARQRNSGGSILLDESEWTLLSNLGE